MQKSYSRRHVVSPARSRAGHPSVRAACGPVIESVEARTLFAAFVVNTAADTVDADAAVTSLREAITAANAAAGADTITFDPVAFATPQTIRLASMLPIVTDDLTITGTGVANLTISGDANNSGTNDAGDVRILFVNRGTVVITDLTLAGGRAKGGDGGGGGMGAGGALFINGKFDGAVVPTNVSLSRVAFSGNAAVGGNAISGTFGGGGLGGNGGDLGGGGGFAGSGGGVGDGGGGFSGSSSNANGGSGAGSPFGGPAAGNGSPSADGLGGGTGGGVGGGGGAGGGAFTPGANGGNGGNGGIGGGGGFGGDGWTGAASGRGGDGGDFGGGGSVGLGFGSGNVGGNGGFGGGGGNSQFNGGGNGGFGGGGGTGFSAGTGGFGGGNGGGGGAGFGGAVFIRSGSLSFTDVTFSNNVAAAGAGTSSSRNGQGLGGAVFFVTPALAAQAGVPGAAPTVTFSNVTYSGNTSTTGSPNVYDLPDPPANTVPGPQTVSEDGSLVFSSANGNPISVASGSGSLTTVVSVPAGTGTLTAVTGGGATITNNGSAAVTVAGTPAQVNAALAGLAYAPPANANGAAYTTVTVASTTTDGSDTDTVGIAVTPVNDAPSFIKGPDQSVTEDFGPVTVPAWASAVSVGPANESAQTPSFVVTNDNNALFSAQPSINAAGDLTYTPAPNAFGTATVTVKLKDDGGTANGGDDESDAQTFTIEVTPVADFSIQDAGVFEGGEGDLTAMQFFITRDLDDGVAAVDYFTVDGTAGTPGDYNAVVSSSVVFLPGQLQKVVIVQVRGDTNVEGDQDFFVHLVNPYNGQIDDGVGRGLIVNDDYALPEIAVTDAAVTEGASGTVAMKFKVTLSAKTDDRVVVNYKTTGGSATSGTDFTSTTGTLTFASFETEKTVTVPVKGDLSIEPDEVFYLDLSSTDPDATMADNRGVGTIVNDDVKPKITIADATPVLEGNSGTTAVTFTVTLSNPTAASVTVKYATADGTATLAKNDYKKTTGTLTFAAGQTTKTFTVLIVGDTKKGVPQETFFVNLSSPTNATILDGQAVGTILNDD